MTLFPSEPKKIRARIRSYERALKKEYDEFGWYDDGYGKRYLLGTLYLLVNDIVGACKHYEWFEETFPDDMGDPMHLLSWTLTLFRAGDTEASLKKLRQTMLSNLYLIPHILQIKQVELDISYGSNLENIDYLTYVPDEVVELWSEPARDWLRVHYLASDTQALRQRVIEINRQLKNEPVGEKRFALVDELFILRRG
jgi:hypothetical protein